MTPDLSTPEGRAELRAHIGFVEWSQGWEGATYIGTDRQAMQVMLDALDASAERENALSREIIALRADLDAAHATIERLTAPVTEEEGGRLASAYLNCDAPMRDVLDAFIARRTETAP